MGIMCNMLVNVYSFMTECIWIITMWIRNSFQQSSENTFCQFGKILCVLQVHYTLQFYSVSIPDTWSIHDRQPISLNPMPWYQLFNSYNNSVACHRKCMYVLAWDSRNRDKLGIISAADLFMVNNPPGRDVVSIVNPWRVMLPSDVNLAYTSDAVEVIT